VPGPRFEVRINASARRSLEGIAQSEQRRILRSLRALASDPRPSGAVLLSGDADDRVWRIRVGDYGVLYLVDDQPRVVLVVRLGHRREPGGCLTELRYCWSDWTD
jgi:mRNA interferase RelE/StbE